MPCCDLRNPADPAALDPAACFRVLAVMCWPEDRTARERFLTRLERDTGLNSGRRPRQSEDQLFALVTRALSKGGGAGNLLWAMVALHKAGERVSMTRAIDAHRAAVGPASQAMGAEWHAQQGKVFRNRDRAKLLLAFRSYRSVAHLLCAASMAIGRNRLADLPTGNENLPRFLAAADLVVEAASGIFLSPDTSRLVPGAKSTPRKSPLLDERRLWRFQLPDSPK